MDRRSKKITYTIRVREYYK